MTAVRLLLLLCVIVWGWTFVAVKLCLLFFQPIAIVGLRFAIGLPLLYAILRAKKIPVHIARGDLRPVLIGSSIIALHFIIQAVALTYTTATNTGWIIAVTPLALAALSYAFLHERLGKAEITGIGIASGGVLLLVYNGDWGNFDWGRSIGDWIILLSAFTWAVYTIASRDLSRKYHPLAVTFVMFMPVMVLGMITTIATTDVRSFAGIPVEAMAGLLFLAVPGMLAQWVWQEGIARLGASKAGIFLYLEPVATTILAIPLLGETASGWTLAGGALVLSGVWIAERRKSVNDGRKKEEET